MAFTIEELQRRPSGAMYVSPARICVTADGRLCDETDPEAVRLLVAAGCEIPAAEAAQYGLIIGDPPTMVGSGVSVPSVRAARRRVETVQPDRGE